MDIHYHQLEMLKKESGAPQKVLPEKENPQLQTEGRARGKCAGTQNAGPRTWKSPGGCTRFVIAEKGKCQISFQTMELKPKYGGLEL